jgi:hypothetical protein
MISIILFIFYYINLRTAAKYITGSHDYTPPPVTVPIPFSGSVNVYFPSINSIISFILVCHTIFYHNNKLIFINNKIVSFFKRILNLPFIKKLLKIKDKKKSKNSKNDKKGLDYVKDKAKQAKEIAARKARFIGRIIRNLPKILLFIIVILIVFKTLMNKGFRSFISLIDRKVSNAQF